MTVPLRYPPVTESVVLPPDPFGETIFRVTF
jgi:hypothetical protein